MRREAGESVLIRDLQVSAQRLSKRLNDMRTRRGGRTLLCGLQTTRTVTARRAAHRSGGTAKPTAVG